MKTIIRTANLAPLVTLVLLVSSCSTTSHLPEDEVLYTGVKQMKVHDAKNTYAESVALTEVEAALAHAPNNAFMGSSSVRTPLPIGLWIYNAMAGKEHSWLGGWLLRTFGSQPVTIARVNPATRTKVATNTLQNYGYLRGYVDYALVNGHNPKKQKISYDIHLSEPYLYDSVRYAFPPGALDSVVAATASKRLLHSGGQFSVPDLIAERERLNTAFRCAGFYYYRPDYIRFFADSLHTPYRVQMLVTPDLDVPPVANRRWHIGRIHTYVRRAPVVSTARQNKNIVTPQDSLRRTGLTVTYDDSLVLGGFKYAYQGRRPPLRGRVLFGNYRFRQRELFDQSHFDQTLANLSNLGVFQSVQFQFTPRDTSSTCDTLDVRVNAVMDRLIDTEFDFSLTQKSNSQVGPKAGLRVSKRNAFGHGETFSVGLKGSYEWQTGSSTAMGASSQMGEGSRPDSWEAGIDASLTYPWTAFPWLSTRRTTYPTSTTFRISADNLKRAGYYRLVSFGAEATYNFQTSAHTTHQFTPLTLTYNQLPQTSARFDSITAYNSALYASLRDQFIPAMQYVLTYDNTSATLASPRHRIATRLVLTAKESGNVVGGLSALAGEKWNAKEKTLLGTPYSQFFKFNAELTNQFKLTDRVRLVTHLQTGILFTYGNSDFAPYSELFYVGGANSIRAFGVRTIGPGRYADLEGRGTYLDQAGDLRIEANAELRFPIVSSLNGALFIDAGNVWLLSDDDAHPGGRIGDGSILRSIALGTGFGLRYDLEFLVLRLDLGIGIHAPYETGRSGYYNIPRFKDGLGLHFAVGYPF